MSQLVHIVCPHCDAVNRLPEERLVDDPNCGGCKQKLFMGEPLSLTSANFQRHLVNSDLPILVDFWAPWCGPCRRENPNVVRLYEKYKDSNTLRSQLETQAEHIQCIVAEGFSEAEVAFGQTQEPKLWDYADNVDTVDFLLKL